MFGFQEAAWNSIKCFVVHLDFFLNLREKEDIGHKKEVVNNFLFFSHFNPDLPRNRSQSTICKAVCHPSFCIFNS